MNRDIGPINDQSGQKLSLARRSRQAHARASVAAGGISTLISAAATGLSRLNRISHLVVSNVSASPGSCFLRDGTAGSNLFAVGVPQFDSKDIQFSGFLQQTTQSYHLVIGGTVGTFDVIAEYVQEQA